MSRPTLIPLIAAAIIFAGFSACDAAPAPGRKDDPTSIGSTHAILMEAETGSVLFDKNPDRLIAPASLAKLMTVEVVFDQIALGNISLDQEFTVSENAWRKGGAPSRGSTMYAAIHSKIKVRDLLKAAIIQSANDACIVLAEAIAGNETEFARMMNDRARELGLTRLTFANATGLPDPNMRVTVREIAKLAAHIIRTYPEYYPWFGEREFTWNKIRQTNRNPLLDMGIGADGLKTGHTQQAGYALAGSAVQNGLRLIVVIAGAKSEKERAEDARRLLEWGFRTFERRTLFGAGETIAEAKVYGGAKSTVSLVSDSDVTIFVPRGGGERLTAKVVYDGPIRAPVASERPAGTLKIWRAETLVIEVPLKTGESVPMGSATQRAVDAFAELMYKLFRAGIGRL
jgi:D-alanyl-D-alanine carboxypeptidase (penicillin-binding protein 5/6)